MSRVVATSAFLSRFTSRESMPLSFTTNFVAVLYKVCIKSLSGSGRIRKGEHFGL